MKSLSKFILFLVALIFVQQSYSQTVTGVVNVEKPGGKQESMPYASVYWLEGEMVVETDDHGRFSFDRKQMEKVSIVATFVGYTQDTVILGPEENWAKLVIREGEELSAARLVARQEANYISKLTSVKTEVISAAGLCKMACCNLAESFENSASVTVGYSDAITGARQIRLLGLSGIYTQMLDENRPVMRGISSPFGLSYIPGQWLESIQIAKGPSSVVNGLEAISGQINLEHRKPTTEQPLFINLFMSSKLRTEANIASSIQLNNKWSTVVLGHVSADPEDHDGNGDGFRDGPNTLQFNIANRWLYMADNGTQIRFGFKALSDDRLGGQMDFKRGSDRNTDLWGSNIKNKGLNGYLKAGFPLSPDNSKNIAVVLDYDYYDMDSYFGLKEYDAIQNSLFSNVIFQNEVNENHRYTLGLSARYDSYNEKLVDYFSGSYNTFFPGKEESAVGGYGEYTYTNGEKVSVVTGLRLDHNSMYGWLLAPRINLKYAFHGNVVFRALAGRGFRSPNVIPDNMGILSTGRQIKVWDELDIEEAWTYGANVTFYFPLGNEESALSFDYFRSDFNSQVVVDQEYDLHNISVYNLEGMAYSNTYQVDFSVEPMERLTMMATYRYSDAKTTYKGQGLVEKPLTSRYKGVFNVQYATRMNIWTFDFTAQLNGPSRLPYFVEGGGESPVYTMLFAQITKRFRDLEIYIGGENLTNYKQKNAIIGASDPYNENFNASLIWGPLMGIKVYAGLRYTLWK